MNLPALRPVLLFLLLCCASPFALAEQVILEGDLQSSDVGQFREIPLHVGNGVRRLVVEFDHDGRLRGATLDIGLRDPQRLRGWSGSNKSSFTVALLDSTPSYLPGPIPQGIWHLLVGVAHIPDQVTVHFRAKVTLITSAEEEADYQLAPARAVGANWYSGDLHAHTGHSDGSCQSQAGARVPCPVHRLLETAVKNGLDFLVVSDHNTLSGLNSLRELQPFYDRLLLIPGIEVTTVQGHSNFIGATQPVEFTLGSSSTPDFDRLISQARLQSPLMLVSINHPVVPPGAMCIGCGFTAPYLPELVEAVEVLNGGSRRAEGGNAEGVLAGSPYWESMLDSGFRPTAVGGSDNHDPAAGSNQSPPGIPTTVVWAPELSGRAILDGVRRGHVWINVDGEPGMSVQLTARIASGVTAMVGDTLDGCSSDPVRFHLAVQGIANAVVEIIHSSAVPRSRRLNASAQGLIEWEESMRAPQDWLRVNVRDAQGKLKVITNPIYFKNICNKQ